MNVKSFCKFALGLAGALLAPAVLAAPIPIGYISFDVTSTGGAAEFDITNLTGINSAPPTFPVTNSISLSDLDLDIQYSSGPDLVFGPTSGYFSPSADGISWTGTALSTSTAQSADGLLGSVDAILTGTFDTTSLMIGGSPVTVGSAFSAEISDPSGLVDGDLGIIYANTSSVATTPEPESLVLLGTGLIALANLRRRRVLAAARKFFSRSALGGGSVVALIFLVGAIPIAAHASTTVDVTTLTSWTNPSTGLAGLTEVTVTGSGFPPGAITPSAVTVAFSTSCGGTAVATTSPGVIKTILGTEEQLSEVLIPASLPKGTYYVSVYGSSVGGVAFSSTTSCSEITVTASTSALAACVPTSSLAVVAGTNVNAYVPFGSWCCSGATGVEKVPLEGSSSTQNFATPGYVNSCAANSVTGEVVCTENTKNVDIINGSTVTTLTSGSTGETGFSGGDCDNCGVGINPTNNTAVIAMGLSGGVSGSGVQLLNLSNNTFDTGFPLVHEVSEDISIDSGRNLILSPGESGYYDLLKIGAANALTEYGNNTGGELDSAAEDCTTGIALASDEFSSDIYITDLTQATFTTGSPGSWTAPGKFISLDGDYFSAGTCGISSAPGTGHLAVVTGEFGGSSYAALLLPSTSGSGTPTLADWAYVASMPTTPDGRAFSAGYDPHTVTAYTSPNTGKSYAVFADYEGGYSPTYLGVVDLACVLALPRSAANYVSGNAASCTRYVAVL